MTSFQRSQLISKTAPYAFAEVDKKVQELKDKGVEVIDFGVGDPKSPTPDFVIDALHEGAKKHATSGYPSYIGSQEYREACAAYMKREWNVELDPETEITSTIGSKEAVFNFPLAFVDPGDVVICPTPGYPPYKVGTRFAGGEAHFVPLLEENDFLIDVDAIPDEICKKAKIIWTNYPNSPSGVMAPREWLEKLVAWAKKHEIIIAADEGCYIDLYFEEKPVSILEVAEEGVITFYSLSKRSNMTGYRVGFAAGDEALISAFKEVKTNIDTGVASFIQDAAAAALADDAHVQNMRDEYREKRDLITAAMKEIGLTPCESKATFYIWQRAPEGVTGELLAQKFLDIGIVVTPGGWISDVTDDGLNPGKDYVRFALVPTMKKVKEACERMQKL